MGRGHRASRSTRHGQDQAKSVRLLWSWLRGCTVCSQAKPKVNNVPGRHEVTKGVHIAIPGASQVGKTQPVHSLPSRPGGLPGPPSLAGSHRPHPALMQAEVLAHAQHLDAEERGGTSLMWALLLLAKISQVSRTFRYKQHMFRHLIREFGEFLHEATFSQM